MTQPVESYVAVAPNQTMPGAQPIRQILTFEYNAALGLYQQVNTEVITAADPQTGLPVRLATSDQMDEVVSLLRSTIRALVAILNVVDETSGHSEDDYITRPAGSGRG